MFGFQTSQFQIFIVLCCRIEEHLKIQMFCPILNGRTDFACVATNPLNWILNQNLQGSLGAAQLRLF